MDSGPVQLLSVACAVLLLVLGLDARFDETTPAQAAQPIKQTLPPAN